jgi:hypothetical protein
LKYSRFWQTAAGDQVRSTLCGRVCSAKRHILRLGTGTLAAGKMGMRASTGLQTWSIRLASALSAVTNFGKCHIALHGRGRSDASVAIATNTDGTASKLPDNIVVVAHLDHALGEHRIGTPGAGQAPGWRPTVERRDFQRNGSARAAASLRESPAAFRAPLVRSQRLRDGAGGNWGRRIPDFQISGLISPPAA